MEHVHRREVVPRRPACRPHGAGSQTPCQRTAGPGRPAPDVGCASGILGKAVKQTDAGASSARVSSPCSRWQPRRKVPASSQGAFSEDIAWHFSPFQQEARAFPLAPSGPSAHRLSAIPLAGLGQHRSESPPGRFTLLPAARRCRRVSAGCRGVVQSVAGEAGHGQRHCVMRLWRILTNMSHSMPFGPARGPRSEMPAQRWDAASGPGLCRQRQDRDGARGPTGRGVRRQPRSSTTFDIRQGLTV